MNHVPATKTNLLKMKKLLSTTEEGHQLLDEKRRILMGELSALVHMVDRLQKDIDEALHQGYALAEKAVVHMGRERVDELSRAVDITSSLSISQRRIMGVTIPVIRLRVKENPPYYSPFEVSTYVDEVIVKFKRILELAAQLAEKKIALLRIAKEVQRTIKKVNGLERIYLPHYRENVKYIGERLEEEARDAFSLLKVLKERMRKK
ncbi:MAG: V-type ATP synthase subunit D [Candidatus Omnitrophica bacterium]|nr:V-type ATP synthase subunit D [Candidatus Omnitrophota bacterium]